LILIQDVSTTPLIQTTLYDGWLLGANKAIGDLRTSTLKIVRSSGGTVGNPAVSILSNGNVGIGSTNPTSLLDLSASDTTSTPLLRIQNYSTSNYRPLDMLAGSLSNGGGITAVIGKSLGLSNYGVWRYTHVADGSTSNRISIENAGGGGLFLNQAGNVGIGRNDPPVRLAVEGSIYTQQIGSLPNDTESLMIAEGSSGRVGMWYKKYDNNTTDIIFKTSTNASSGTPVERMRIESGGYTQFTNGISINTTSNGLVGLKVRFAVPLACVNSADSFYWYVNGSVEHYADYNTATSILYVGSTITGDRSINAGGSVNTFGTDYAEYMSKDQTQGQFTIEKGDIAGITTNGLLTNKYDESVTFAVKSTKPSFVGGDSWSRKNDVGDKPIIDKENATQEEKDEYAVKLAEWEVKYETERQKVDRIAFSGQVPVNVSNAIPGDYIVPVRSADGGISGISVADSNITFDQYRKAVGKVIKNIEEGKALIIVKIP
jgi:hypothetical protein